MSADLYQQYEEDFLAYLSALTRTADNLSTASSKGILLFVFKIIV